MILLKLFQWKTNDEGYSADSMYLFQSPLLQRHIKCSGVILHRPSKSRIQTSWITVTHLPQACLIYLFLIPHEGERACFVFNGLRWIQGSIRVWIPQPCDTTPPTLTKEFSIPVSTFVSQAIARQSCISFQFTLKPLEHSLAMELIDFCLAENGDTLTPTC